MLLLGEIVSVTDLNVNWLWIITHYFTFRKKNNQKSVSNVTFMFIAKYYSFSCTSLFEKNRIWWHYKVRKIVAGVTKVTKMLINCVITVHFVLGQTDCHCASNPTPYALSSPADVDKFFIPPTPTPPQKSFLLPLNPWTHSKPELSHWRRLHGFIFRRWWTPYCWDLGSQSNNHRGPEWRLSLSFCLQGGKT